MCFGSEFDKPNFDYPTKFRQETLKVGLNEKSRLFSIAAIKSPPYLADS